MRNENIKCGEYKPRKLSSVTIDSDMNYYENNELCGKVLDFKSNYLTVELISKNRYINGSIKQIHLNYEKRKEGNTDRRIKF